MSQSAAKRPINLSLDADLLARARAYGVDLSALVEDALRVRIGRQDAQIWLDENREAIAAQNAWTAERGLFSDEFRSW